jgi:hypothetical protein
MGGTCPAGHRSETDDYCDLCGAAMAPANVTTTRPDLLIRVPAPAAAIEALAGEACAHCGNPSAAGDRFCEVCGCDLVTGDVNVAQHRAEAQPLAFATVEAEPRPGWRLFVDADRGHYQRVGPAGITFPNSWPQRVFDLTGDVIVIGRGEEDHRRPEIDLGGEPEDRAVSRRQAQLERNPDGSYTAVDLGSTNGILVNDDPLPMPPRHKVVLKDGDRLYIGAWTRIEVRRV